MSQFGQSDCDLFPFLVRHSSVFYRITSINGMSRSNHALVRCMRKQSREDMQQISLHIHYRGEIRTKFRQL